MAEIFYDNDADMTIIQGRKVAILVADGVVGQHAADIHAALAALGAAPRFVAPRIGPVNTADGVCIVADASLENEPGVLFDALAIADGSAAVAELARHAQTMECVKDQFRHCKPMLVLGDAKALLKMAAVPLVLSSGDPDPGLIVADSAKPKVLKQFIAAIAAHRHTARETDPPLV